jgi:DNA-binding response OmpR family regulator
MLQTEGKESGMSRNEIVRNIYQLPPEERLDYAVEVIRELTGDGGEYAMFVNEYNMSDIRARVCAALLQQAPKVVARSGLALFLSDNASPKTVDAHICYINKALGEKWIKNKWGVGYYVEGEPPEPREK